MHILCSFFFGGWDDGGGLSCSCSGIRAFNTKVLSIQKRGPVHGTWPRELSNIKHYELRGERANMKGYKGQRANIFLVM